MRLPEPVPPVLADALARQSPQRRSALVDHLLGGTSADYLVDWFERAGAHVPAIAIQDYRQGLVERGGGI